jgi:hypothetical protein
MAAGWGVERALYLDYAHTRALPDAERQALRDLN